MLTRHHALCAGIVCLAGAFVAGAQAPAPPVEPPREVDNTPPRDTAPPRDAALPARSFIELGDAQIAAMLDGYELFKLGYSWGGYESLVMTSQLANIRTVSKWKGGPVVRYHVGLENAEDLIRDLDKGFERLAR